ncbi:MAG: hypothetical protein HN952_08150 [Candidatus Cloacimonetes bacterium]|nr:hypothetical protein [Candidatus Cloacimonadota bacterium]MBT7469757.1 hypothetical protein [Candidatus Cloacimonadota bacterium]
MQFFLFAGKVVPWNHLILDNPSVPSVFGTKISYQIVRDRLTEQMDFLRQYKDVKLNNKKDEY